MNPRRGDIAATQCKFTCEEISARDKTSLDLFGLQDKSLADLNNFRTVLAALGK